MKYPDFFSFKRSIQSKIFISFILVLILPTITISISTYFISLNILKDKVSSSFSQTALYVRNSVERELEQVKLVSDYIFVDNNIKEALLTSGKSKYQVNKDGEAADVVFKNYSIANIFRYINIVKIYGFEDKELLYTFDDTLRYAYDDKITKSIWFEKSLKSNGQIVWAGMGDKYTKESYSDVHKDISLFRVIKDKDYKSNIGVMYISVQPRVFSQLVDKMELGEDSNIFIMDNNDKIINKPIDSSFERSIVKVLKSSGKRYSGNYRISGKNEFVVCYHIENFDWKVVGILPVKEITKGNKVIFYATALAFVISFIFSCIIWYFISSGIAKPVKRLSNAMNSIKEGNLNVRVSYDRPDEIGALSKNFNYMIERIDQLFHEVVDKQKRIMDAEYKALQAQINPHFLYNTLNSIRWMAIIQKADNIKKVVDALGRLLRNSTSKMEQIITIQEEIDNLKDYIYIQKLAYKNKFEIEWDIDERVLSHRCIKFILQPLVENAIFHGIEPKDYFGTISISANLMSNMITFTVKDDGVGMSQSQIETVLSPEGKHKGRFSGIGIGNVNERIKMTYGDNYGLTIESVEESYTSIVVRLPLENL